MTRTTSDLLDSKLSALWRSACDDYAKKTGIALTACDFPKVRGPEDLSRQLDAEKDHFEDFRKKKRPLFHAMQTVLVPFENWGDLIVGTAAVAFPPAGFIMGAMMLLIRGARRVSESFDMLTDLFDKLGHFAPRLDSYRGVPLSEGMKTIIVKVLVNFLRVCAVSQELLSRGSLRARLKKWKKNVLVEDTSISSLLGELEELTSQEHKVVSAHGLDLTHQALRNTAELLKRDDNTNYRERLDRVKKALDPVSASGRVFSAINENRIPGSGSWIENRIRSWWHGPEPLLWIHGGPGMGKSYLASKIISDLATAEPSAPSAPIVASFFFKSNDLDLCSFNKALRTLAWQAVVQRSGFAAHAEDFCLKEDPANSHVVWRKLLLDYFVASPPDSRICFIIDGIDEADPEEQEILFSLLEKAYATEDRMGTPSIRLVLLGRNSVRGILDEHSLEWIPEIEITNDQNKDDLSGYISQKLQKTKLFQGSPDFQAEVVRDICGQAEGLWEWANLVIKSVLRCRTKEQIRKVVRTMPRGISAMLHAELERLARELSAADAMLNELPDELSDEEGSAEEATGAQIQQLEVLLSFVTKAQKPLTVEQLDLILEVILEEEVLNLENDLRTVYSSLFSLRLAGDEEEEGNDAVMVTLRHSSFYEFFSKPVEAGSIQLDPDRAEASVVFVLLYALQRNFAPVSKRLLGPVNRYAQKFLPLHLSRANLEKAANRREVIATLLAALFTEEPGFKPQHWLIENCRLSRLSEYLFYPSSHPTEIARYWWNTRDRDTANKRAELVLNWLSPDAKQLLQDCARSSTVASDDCPFTVLFSRLAQNFSRLWLVPKDIKEEDGLPGVLSSMLFVYSQMAAIGPTSGGKLKTLVPGLEPRKILHIAEIQHLEKTPIWHARLAQAILLNHNYAAAIEQFQIALDEHHRKPFLSKQALSVIHRDMARACTKVGRYKEALEHSDMAESLYDDSWDRGWQDSISKLLNTAQMEHLAKMTEKAVATANEAWEAFVGQRNNYRDRDTLHSFFWLFLQLHKPDRVQDVFDFAVSLRWTEKDDLVEFLTSAMIWAPRLIYQVLHYALMRGDGKHIRKHIDLVALIPGRVAASRETQTDNLAAAKYLLASVMFEHGLISTGIQAWYEVVSLDNPDGWNIEAAQTWSRSRLAAVCLYHPELPFSTKSLLRLNENTESSDICLVISSWLGGHGDITNAREALRGRVKRTIELLSDDGPSNDDKAFMILFRTFLVAADSHEDLNGALYLLKVWHRDCLQQAKRHLPDDGTEGPDDDDFPFSIDQLAECSNCKREMNSICHWYFCRSCPLTAICRRCYHGTGSTTSHLRGICDPRHEFYYTGPPLRTSERVPAGMMALESSDGKRQTIWIEEWKDKLLEKWGTEDFAFEGGLSAWCMRVLPEPQRSRWAAFFR